MKRKVFGVIIILIALFWCWYYGQMVFDHFYYGDQLWYCFRPPIPVSIINTIFGALGLLVGIKTYQNLIKPRTATIRVISLFILGFLIDTFSHLLF